MLIGLRCSMSSRMANGAVRLLSPSLSDFSDFKAFWLRTQRSQKIEGSSLAAECE